MELKVHDQEIELQRLWKSRKLFKQGLRTLTGKDVEVMFGGVENLDAGPDFKDAVIKLDGNILKGDIEVHLEPTGWVAHNHHTDPAYNNVVLHVIASPSSESQMWIEREDGVKVEQVHIELNSVDESFKKKLESKSSTGQIIENCPLSRENRDAIWKTVEVAGEERFLSKVEQIREDRVHHSWDHIIYARILNALGYSKNQTPFRKLAKLIPYETVNAEMQWIPEEMALRKCTALLLGAAGLLPSQRGLPETELHIETVDYVGPLELLWRQMKHRLMIKALAHHEWQFFRLRPQNFPTRRIAGMGCLLHRFYRDGLLNGLLKIVGGHKRDLSRLSRELEKALLVKTDGFWERHYDFTGEDKGLRKTDEALIGSNRAKDIVINIVLPVLYLYACDSNDGMLKNLVRELYARYPKTADNAITKVMTKQLFRGEMKREKPRSAIRQQGMVHLQKLYCTPLRCTDCLKLSRKGLTFSN